VKKNVVCIALLTVAFFTQSALAEDVLRRQAAEALKRATSCFRSISTNGGYCGIYSLDLKQRYGEATYEKAKDNEIWVQPPGTPTVGQCYLRAYKATGDKFYFDAARDVARALVWGQRQIGGWDHRVDVSHLTPDAKKPVRRQGRCTFDDKITQGALEFLIDADAVISEPWLDEAIELGLQFMIKSQFENGAWPQWYPLRGGYHDYYTFNDNSINDCIGLMLNAHRTYGDKKYLRSAMRGGDFIVMSQLAAPQAGWAQQYNHDMKPAWARTFEPPGVCSAATVRNINTLIDLYLYTKDDKYLKPIDAAIEWLNDSMLGEHLWARLYEVGTNRQIYGDRMDGNKVHYDYEKVSVKERTSYGWRGEYGVASTIRRYERVKSASNEAFADAGQRPLSKKERSRRALAMSGDVKSVIGDLDEKGRWVSGDTITCQTFVQNASMLCRYLEYAK